MRKACAEWYAWLIQNGERTYRFFSSGLNNLQIESVRGRSRYLSASQGFHLESQLLHRHEGHLFTFGRQVVYKEISWTRFTVSTKGKRARNVVLSCSETGNESIDFSTVAKQLQADCNFWKLSVSSGKSGVSFGELLSFWGVVFLLG